MQANVVGPGTYQLSSYSISTVYPEDPDHARIEYYGTGYQVTAVPNAGATYDHSDWTFHRVWKYSTDGGSTWTILDDDDRQTTTVQTVMQPDLPASNSYIGDNRYIGFEGTRTDTNSGSNYIFMYEFTLQNVTLYFTGSHVPTHLIIRDDTTGKIMIGGAQNEILRDD